MHSVAGSAIGNALGSATLGEAVIAVGVGRNAVGRQIVTRGEALVAVAPPTRGDRDTGRTYQRCGFFGAQDEMLAVAVAADRGIGHASLHGLSVYAFKISLADIRMAMPASRRDIPVVDLGTRILRGKDSVASVTIGAGCSSSISVGHCAAVHALFIKFHRMREWNVVPGEKLLVAVTGGAGVRQIFLGHRRARIARRLNLMHRSVAGHASRRVRIACLSGLSVNALTEFCYLTGVAMLAL